MAIYLTENVIEVQNTLQTAARVAQNITLILLTGIFQLVAFALALIPNEVSDQFGGYRIYGIFAHLFSGFGWAALGWTFLKGRGVVAVGAA